MSEDKIEKKIEKKKKVEVEIKEDKKCKRIEYSAYEEKMKEREARELAVHEAIMDEKGDVIRHRRVIEKYNVEHGGDYNKYLKKLNKSEERGAVAWERIAICAESGIKIVGKFVEEYVRVSKKMK